MFEAMLFLISMVFLLMIVSSIAMHKGVGKYTVYEFDYCLFSKVFSKVDKPWSFKDAGHGNSSTKIGCGLKYLTSTKWHYPKRGEISVNINVDISDVKISGRIAAKDAEDAVNLIQEIAWRHEDKFKA